MLKTLTLPMAKARGSLTYFKYMKIFLMTRKNGIIGLVMVEIVGTDTITKMT